ncbi:MAG: tetratricopeptide repeat protein [Balneolaceae bacterium]|nr:tetratricopeptide repeat protein [Balneolaceae bacterium]
MSNRLSKEELETDPLIENYNRAVGFYHDNKTILLSLIVGLVVIIGSLVGYRYYADSQEQKAQHLLATAQNYYDQGDYESALKGNEFELTYGFQQIADEFSGTNAGNLAIYFAGVSSFKLGNVEGAINYVSRYDVPEGILGVGPVSFLGNLYEATGDYTQAAETYVQAANWDVNESTTPFNLLKAARAYYKAGNTAQASELTSKIIDEYANSTELSEAKKIQGMLAAK